MLIYTNVFPHFRFQFLVKANGRVRTRFLNIIKIFQNVLIRKSQLKIKKDGQERFRGIWALR